jgi:hypothetical protein
LWPRSLPSRIFVVASQAGHRGPSYLP